MRRRPTLHVIPATILAAGLVLTIKVGNIWHAVTGEAELVPIASAEEQIEETEPEVEAGEPGSPNGEAAPPAMPSRSAREKGELRGAAVPYTSSELELLQKLSARREELDSRERELEVREGLLKAAEQQLESRSAELAAVRQKITGLVRDYDEQESKKLESLVKIYERMKPKDAARIMNDLEMDVLLDVMHRMREAKAAPILASMEPERARAVTARLAERGSLAGFDGKS